MVMNLNFHNSEKDANASLAVLSVYLDTLLDYFSFYSSLQPQFYTMKENEFITLQSLFHFLKLFQICFAKAEVYELIQKFEDKIRMPVDDTLNIKNGLNFAQFLECILQSAYFKLNEAGRTQEDDAYGDTLQKLFQTATNEIKHRAADDFLSAELYSAESQKVFYDNYGLLAAIF
jgi:hypothetical protein